jgi:hypothetical protein
VRNVRLWRDPTGAPLIDYAILPRPWRRARRIRTCSAARFCLPPAVSRPNVRHLVHERSWEDGCPSNHLRIRFVSEVQLAADEHS